MLWVLICTVHLTVCSSHVTHAFQSQSTVRPAWLNGWEFIYELSGCGFESSFSHLNFRFCACFEQGVPWHSGKYKVCIHSETRVWHDKNIQSNVQCTDKYSQHSSIKASLANWLSVQLWTKWLWVWVQLHPLFLISFLIWYIMFFCPSNYHHHTFSVKSLRKQISFPLRSSLVNVQCFLPNNVNVAVSLWLLNNLHKISSVNPLTSFQSLFSIICFVMNIRADVFMSIKFCPSHILHFCSCFLYISHCISFLLYYSSLFSSLPWFSSLVWILYPVCLHRKYYFVLNQVTLFSGFLLPSFLNPPIIWYKHNTLHVTLFLYKRLLMIWVLFLQLFFSCTIENCLPVAPTCSFLNPFWWHGLIP